MHRRMFLLPLALLLVSCATTQGGSRRSTGALTAEEIGELVVTTAYEAVEQARPQWLRSRSSPSMANPDPMPPVLYVDGLRFSDVDELRRIRADTIERMEFLSPTDATNRFGTNHGGGAILVTTRSD